MKNHKSLILQRVFVCLLFAIGLASTAMAQRNIPSPVISGPIYGGVHGRPFMSAYGNLAVDGYMEQEFFIEGRAVGYEASPTGLASTGLAAPLPEAYYKTRIVVRRPVDPKRFNGVVMLEWFNVTQGFDQDLDWVYLKRELMRRGAAYVAVSAQAVGVEGTPQSLKSWDPVRYAGLLHPGDQYAYDIYSQAAQALRDPVAGPAPLGGLRPQIIIADGASQSASTLNVYVNQVVPQIEAVIDGFLIEVGDGELRADLGVPVLRILSETEVSRGATQQADSPFYRQWEIAGSSHSDRFQLNGMNPRIDRDLATLLGDYPVSGEDSDRCLINRYPKVFAVRAAFHSLVEWVEKGTAAPTAPRMRYDGSTIVRDEHGNALGGLRLPAIEVPIASYSGEFINDCAPLAGKTELFDEAKLLALYPTRRDYLDAVRRAVQASRQEGHLLREDAEQILAEAEMFDIWQ